jgi:hypothetical protein
VQRGGGVLRQVAGVRGVREVPQPVLGVRREG